MPPVGLLALLAVFEGYVFFSWDLGIFVVFEGLGFRRFVFLFQLFVASGLVFGRMSGRAVSYLRNLMLQCCLI